MFDTGVAGGAQTNPLKWDTNILGVITIAFSYSLRMITCNCFCQNDQFCLK